MPPEKFSCTKLSEMLENVPLEDRTYGKSIVCRAVLAPPQRRCPCLQYIDVNRSGNSCWTSEIYYMNTKKVPVTLRQKL